MMIVICKRFRHLATQKSQETGLSQPTRQLFIAYRNALGDLVNIVYTTAQNKIIKRRTDVQTRPGVLERESDQAEARYNEEITEFKQLFGNAPLSNIDWNVQRDWTTILNQRWMAEHHS
jgi:hypothetical protein